MMNHRLHPLPAAVALLLCACVQTRPDAPRLTASVPASPSMEQDPTIQGTAGANLTVRLYTNANCGGAPTGTTTADGGGQFDFTVTVNGDAETVFYASAENGDLVSSCSLGFSYVHDETPPFVGLVSTTPTSPNVDSMPLVRGNTEADASVQLYVEADCGGSVVGTGTADDLGVFEVAVTEPLIGNVTTEFAATATDAVGNISNCSVPLAYFVTVPESTFAAPTVTPVIVNVHSVAIGDLDGDGHLDLVTANLGNNNVSVLLGDGGGAFEPATNFPTGDFPNAVAIDDLDEDGDLDIVTANGSDSVSVLLGGGNGAFAPATDFPGGDFPDAVAIDDMNRDGDLDLVTANRLSDNVSVLLGNGDGTFEPKFDLGVGDRPSSVAIGDLDGDGHDDLEIVTANRSDNNVSVLTGAFEPTIRFGVGQSPASVAIADLNGDGHLDLVTANENADTVSVLLGGGDGAFAPAMNATVADRPFYVAIGDLNGDGRPDVVTAHFISPGTVSVLLGRGDGTFIEAAASPFKTGGDGATSVALADLDGDGRLDLVTANQSSGDVSVLLNQDPP